MSSQIRSVRCLWRAKILPATVCAAAVQTIGPGCTGWDKKSSLVGDERTDEEARQSAKRNANFGVNKVFRVTSGRAGRGLFGANEKVLRATVSQFCALGRYRCIWVVTGESANGTVLESARTKVTSDPSSLLAVTSRMLFFRPTIARCIIKILPRLDWPADDFCSAIWMHNAYQHILALQTQVIFCPVKVQLFTSSFLHVVYFVSGFVVLFILRFLWPLFCFVLVSGFVFGCCFFWLLFVKDLCFISLLCLHCQRLNVSIHRWRVILMFWLRINK